MVSGVVRDNEFLTVIEGRLESIDLQLVELRKEVRHAVKDKQKDHTRIYVWLAGLTVVIVGSSGMLHLLGII